MKLTLLLHNRLITLLVFCCVFTGMCQAQLWNKTYIEDRPLMLFCSIEQDTSFKVIGLTTRKQPPYFACILSASISDDGSMSNYKTSGDSQNVNYGVFTNSLIKTLAGDYAFTGYADDSIPRLLFARFDNSIDSIKVYTYYTANTYTFKGYGIIQTDDNSFFVAGVKTDSFPNNANVVLVKIDSNGNRMWEKYYDQFKQDYAKSIIQLSNKNILLGCVRRDLNQTNEHANTWLLEVDTGGNFVRQWFDPSDSTYFAEGLKQTKDGGFIYGAQRKIYQVGGALGYTASIIKMDSNFNKQWAFAGGVMGTFTGFCDIELLPNMQYLACGNYSNGQAWIVKLDMNGHIIWERKYKGLQDTTSTWNILTDLDVLPDGSLVAVGQCQRIVNPNSLPPQVGWFLKLDSNGCEIENCLVDIDEISQKPVNTSLTVLYNQDGKSITFEAGDMLRAEIKIYDIAGKIAYQGRVENYKESISTMAYAPGVYVLHLQKENVSSQAKFVIY